MLKVQLPLQCWRSTRENAAWEKLFRLGAEEKNEYLDWKAWRKTGVSGSRDCVNPRREQLNIWNVCNQRNVKRRNFLAS